jgi:flagellar basal body-associated protein FliL
LYFDKERKGVSTVALAVVLVIVIAGVAIGAYELGSSKPGSTSTTSTSSTTSAVVTTSRTSSSTSSASYIIPQNSITSTTTSAQTFTNYTGNAALAGQLVITKVSGDVNSSSEQQVLYSLYFNTTTFSGNLPFVGNPGQSFWLQVSLQFNACPCVGVVQSVVAVTPGFVILATSPAAPIGFSGGGGDYYQAGYWVEVMAPPTPYDGPLVLMNDVE